MDSIIAALQEEKKEAGKLIRHYARELKKLPKGSFFARNSGNKGKYGYLTYSENGTVKQKYLGKLSDSEILRCTEMMVRKKKLIRLKKMAELQKGFLEKSLRHASKKS